MNDVSQSILAAREYRWQQRILLAREQKGILVTVTLCVPTPYRTRADFQSMFRDQSGSVVRILDDSGLKPTVAGFLDGADGSACFILTQGRALDVKSACVSIEQTLPGGRMLDIDVLDEQGSPIGRQELGVPPRLCFVCDRAAVICVSRRQHAPEEVAAQVERMVAEMRQGH